jgi:DNA-directed RNA polymerase subunit RPC12/RpoP
MKCADCNTEISQSKPKLCPYCGSRNLVKDSKEECKNELILLETKIALLFKDRFVYNGRTYPISSMKSASIDSSFLGDADLIIKFKDGLFKRFRVGTMSGSSQLNALLSNFTIDTSSQEIEAVTQQFVTTINMLISMQ